LSLPPASSQDTWAHPCSTTPTAANTTSCSASPTAPACGPGSTPPSAGAGWPRAGQLLEADQGLQQLTGLETWFKLPGGNVPTMKPPPRWKMWLVSVVAVYPLVLTFQALLVPRMAGLPLPLKALSFPLVLLTLMTFVVMPVVTRLLRRWLGPGLAATGSRSRGTDTLEPLE
jgi:hypothetical protein